MIILSNKTKSYICFLLFLLLCCAAIFIGTNIKTPIDNIIQETQCITIKDNTNHIEQVDTWLIPDSLTPKQDELIMLTALLDAYNISVNLEELNNYLPAKDVIFEKELRNGLSTFLTDYNVPIQPLEKALMIDDITALINAGTPVMVWITSDSQAPRWNNSMTEYSNEITAIITDIGQDTITILNPIIGFITMEKSTFIVLYEACGCHALWLQEL